MKLKWIPLLAAGVMALSLAAAAGCKDDNTDGKDNKQEGEYGTLTIDDAKVYITADSAYTFAELNPAFSAPDKAETLTYTYDTNYIKIENNIVTPVKRADKTVNVRAKSEHFNVVFQVEVDYIRFTDSLYKLDGFDVAGRAETCKAVTENTTLFIGDSFMDSYFIGAYMETYADGKDVMNAGISSTKTYHWEAAYKKIIGTTAPKNIVLHIGTNNFYDEPHDMVEDTEDSLARLFMFIHSSYPTSNIYWFNITQRENTDYASHVTETNEYMAEWCGKYSWITCVDTCSKVSVADLDPKDGTHPKTESYKIFTDALEEAGCEIATKS